MVTDSGTRAMRAKKQRQWVVLGVLCAIAAVILVVRLVQHQPATVSASAPDSASAPGHFEPPDLEVAYEMPAFGEVSWPVRVERDLFAWEAVFEIEQEPEDPEPDEPDPAEIDTGPDREAIHEQAGRDVRLHAIIYGEDPIAMINGEIHRQGETVAGFRLRRIEPRRIVIEKEGVQIDIDL